MAGVREREQVRGLRGRGFERGEEGDRVGAGGGEEKGGEAEGDREEGGGRGRGDGEAAVDSPRPRDVVGSGGFESAEGEGEELAHEETEGKDDSEEERELEGGGSGLSEVGEQGQDDGSEEQERAEESEKTCLGLPDGGESFGKKRAYSGGDEERGDDDGRGEDGTAEERVRVEDERDFDGHEASAEAGEVEEDVELAGCFPAEAEERQDDAEDGEGEEEDERDGDRERAEFEEGDGVGAEGGGENGKVGEAEELGKVGTGVGRGAEFERVIAVERFARAVDEAIDKAEEVGVLPGVVLFAFGGIEVREQKRVETLI